MQQHSSLTQADIERVIKEIVIPQIADNPIILYMKGHPNLPKCGFSAQVVKCLKTYQVPFTAIDVLQDEAIRAAIKAYSRWPTIPQLYIRGEFIGGCDIITEMHQNGELQEKLTTVTAG